MEEGVHLTSDVSGPMFAALDSLVLRQVLRNFLENSLKYGPPGQRVQIGAAQRGDHVCVWVDDEGPGVSAAERFRIWEPFYRGVSVVQSVSGSGIGLAVVRDLVLRHGGSAVVEEAPSGGARFTVTFGVSAAPAERPASGAER